MLIEPEPFDDAQLLGSRLAADIIGMMMERTPGRRYVLGCPAGRSLLPTYRALAELARAQGCVDAALTLVMMDEYLSSAAPPQRCDPGSPYSCIGFARREIAAPLSPLLRGGVEVCAPDPAAPDAYEALLEELGGIDLFLLASGASDGHVAFNPPGSARDSRTRIVELAPATRQDNLATFPAFGDLESVPTHGISVGIDTIVRHSKSVVMVLTGAAKAKAAARILVASDYEPGWPATVVHACRQPRIMVDRAAAQASISR